jgi:thioredoxin 1
MPISSLPAVGADGFTAEVLESGTPVLVDFTAVWCAPCRVMRPVLDELAADRGDVRFVTLDIDEEPELAARYDVLSAPTFILFRDGAPVLRLVGSRPRRRLERELDEVL